MRRTFGSRRRSRLRSVGFTLAGLAVLAGGLAVAAYVAWPKAALESDPVALARLTLPGFAGTVEHVRVETASGAGVPVTLAHGRLSPAGKLDAGEALDVSVTVRRPGWAGWLVGRSETRRFVVVTPTAKLRARWLAVKTGRPVQVSFDAPVSAVALGRGPAKLLTTPAKIVPIGIVASGSHSSGAVGIAAVARTWERLPARTRVSWFPARPYPQLLAEPAVGSALRPADPITLTFSGATSAVLGSAQPKVLPHVPGRWVTVDAHTIAFHPSGLGFGLGTSVRVVLPQGVHVAAQAGSALTRSLDWHVPAGSILRLQQILAELGYLPVDWQPTDDAPPQGARAELTAAVSPPPGRFSWRYPNTPPELRALWQAGFANQITRGAVMMFEDTHNLAVDGIAGPIVWRALIRAVLSGAPRRAGYSYVFVHRDVPQSLNLWHDGRVILTSPGNTGVPAAPTQLGTYPVFEHIPVGEMKGTNPDGSHYDDPGIRYISYFHGGDAIHSFNRASYGTPQSLGCVELPLPAAATVWPYTPIGTLVTIEN